MPALAAASIRCRKMPAEPRTSRGRRSWAIHVMAHVYAARHLIPRMRARGGGYFLNTISAAGLLSQVGSGAYSTTKHAAVGFAENLAISHKAHNIRVSILCPQGVETNMLRGCRRARNPATAISRRRKVAQARWRALDRETFLILPHPQVHRLHAQEDRELRPLDRRHGARSRPSCARCSGRSRALFGHPEVLFALLRAWTMILSTLLH